MYVGNDTLRMIYRKVILTVLKDYQGKVCSPEKSPGTVRKIKEDAEHYILSEDCKFICECVGLDYYTLLQNKNIPLKLTKVNVGPTKKRGRKHKKKNTSKTHQNTIKHCLY
jgi:hypothetical protein